MFCDIRTVQGGAFDGDPRQCLKRVLKKAADQGYTFYVGPEIEFFYFQNAEGTKVLDQGGYFDLTSLDAGSAIWDNLRFTQRLPINAMLHTLGVCARGRQQGNLLHHPRLRR